MLIMEWPAYSLDVKPIEHLWDGLGRAVTTHMDRHHTHQDSR